MNRSRLLGWALLGYALLSARTLVRLAAALGAPGRVDAWPLGIDALLWLLLVVGGLGLVLDRAWSRWVVVFSSSCSLLSLAAGLLVSINLQAKFGMPPLLLRSSVVWALAGSLPLLVFLLGSWRLRGGRPGGGEAAAGAPAPAEERRRRLDLAYGCYLFVAVVVLFFYLLYRLAAFHRPGDDLTPMLAVFVLVPAACGAAVVGVLVSLAAWREGLVPVLAVATVAVFWLLAALLSTEAGLARGRALDAALVLYVAGVAALGARWFLGARRRA